jgi:hypothetical protein
MPGLERPKSSLRRPREALPLGLVVLLGFCLAAVVATIVLLLVFGAPEITTPPPDR